MPSGSETVNVRIGALVGVGLLELGLVALLLVHEDDDAEDEDLGADAEERPEGGELVLDPDVGPGDVVVLLVVVGHVVEAGAGEVAPVLQLHVLDVEYRVVQALVLVLGQLDTALGARVVLALEVPDYLEARIADFDRASQVELLALDDVRPLGQSNHGLPCGRR